jgi:hypothetical protein
MVVSGCHCNDELQGGGLTNKNGRPGGKLFGIREFLKGIGFIVMDKASIPSQGFLLPTSRKIRDAPVPQRLMRRYRGVY